MKGRRRRKGRRRGRRLLEVKLLLNTCIRSVPVYVLHKKHIRTDIILL
jgi:hypothetical protein